MESFFNNVPYDDALEIEQASRLIFELRENRAALLQGLGVDNEDELLPRIADGRLAEHPAYEQYLSARILRGTRALLRRQLAQHLSANFAAVPLADGDDDEAAAPVLLPVELKAHLEERYGEHLAGEIGLAQDALLLHLANGVALELRVLSADAYSFAWLCGEATLRIDTAPGSQGASHFHAADGSCRTDPLTVPGRDPRQNVGALIDALLRDPLFGVD